MTAPKYYNHADSSQPEIVKTLRDHRYEVDIQRKPVDLRVRHPSWPWPIWFEIECKTPTGKKQQPRKRKDMQEQDEYCARIGVPKVTTGEQALAAVRCFEVESGART